MSKADIHTKFLARKTEKYYIAPRKRTSPFSVHVVSFLLEYSGKIKFSTSFEYRIDCFATVSAILWIREFMELLLL